MSFVRPPTTEFVLGLDPGFTGGWFALSPTRVPLGSGAMPCHRSELREHDLHPHRLRALIQPLGTPRLTVIEHVTPFAKASRQACFSFGRVFQCLIDLCELECWPYRLISPLTWKRKVLKGYSQSDKQGAMDFCQSELGLTTTHDGVADAACLAEYARVLAFEGGYESRP